jgi:60 kDa SS-A/Ro ribonucleoprotein
MPNDGGGTNLSLPVQYALQQKLNVDVIIILTDNETWHGRGHTQEMLVKYRKEINPNTKLIVFGFSSNSSTIVDPKDNLSLGIAGLDSAGPSLASDFILNG